MSLRTQRLGGLFSEIFNRRDGEVAKDINKNTLDKIKQLAIIGGGPAGLFLYRALIDAKAAYAVTIFESQSRLGEGMPYSEIGAGVEHITNVSANEIPELETSFMDWVKTVPAKTLERYGLKAEVFHEYKVIPRLLFGDYLTAQFELLLAKGKQHGMATKVYLNRTVERVADEEEEGTVKIVCSKGDLHTFDHVVITTGHRWPKKHEGKVEGWFDSPYPPAKLKGKMNFPVAIKGASLTAVDAIRTISRTHGEYKETGDQLSYALNDDAKDFRIVLHSIDGLLPAIRFHLEDSHLSQGHEYTEEEIADIKEKNDGFVPLDLVFEQVFKEGLRKRVPEFYESIRDMRMEEFVDHIMSLRERVDPFVLFKAEYKEAEKSIEQHKSVYWKEMLAVLSFEMNYPAKHFSAEDMMRLKKKLAPLLSIILAFMPQSSCDEMIALYDAGVLRVQSVDEDSSVTPIEEGGCIYRYEDEEGKQQETIYKVFINAVGQEHFMIDDFIFPDLVEDKTVSQAWLKLRDAEKGKEEKQKQNNLVIQTTTQDYWLKVPGININDHYQVLNEFGEPNPRIQIMAVPYIGGLNPDYSGLDFCERAAGLVAEAMGAVPSRASGTE